jgi:hypothetical protein
MPRTRQAMKQRRPAATDDGMNDDAVLVDEPEEADTKLEGVPGALLAGGADRGDGAGRRRPIAVRGPDADCELISDGRERGLGRKSAREDRSKRMPAASAEPRSTSSERGSSGSPAPQGRSCSSLRVALSSSPGGTWERTVWQRRKAGSGDASRDGPSGS